MINSCGISEGDNEFVLFTTGVTANASTYTLRYGTTNPPSASTMSGADANIKTGTAVFTNGGGCTLINVTSPATSIPAGSKVIFISTNADMNYDFTSLCGGSTIYVVYIKFNGSTSNWNPVGTFANSLAVGVSRYLQITYSGSSSCNNTNAPVKSYQNGWSPNQDGDFVSWSGTTPTYSNDAAAINTPPADASVCSPAATSFTVSGSGYQVTYQWQFSTDGGATWSNLSNIGVYTGTTSTTLNISNSSGLNNYKFRAVATALAPCSPTAASTAATLTVTVAPVAVATVTQQPDCIATTGTVTITPSGVNYNYNINGGAYQTSNVFTGLTAGATYIFTVKDISGGCVSAPVSVTIGNVPTAPIAPSGSVTQQPTCTTPTGTIVISAPTGVNYQYNINGGAYQSSTTFTSLSPNTYSVTVKDISTGCVSSATTFTVNATSPVTVNPIFGNNSICVNPNNTTQLTNNTIGGVWSSSSPNIATINVTGLVTANAPGTTIISYTVTNNGCQNSATLQVTVHDLQITLSSSNNNITAGNAITLSVSGNASFNVTKWTPIQFFSNQSAVSQNIKPTSTQTYTVYATDGNGCTASATTLVTVKQTADDIFVPNAFTPNADGKNDLLLVFGNSISQLEMHIFNQWGQEIFSINDKSVGWDGTVKGKAQPVGVYVYVLQAILSNGEFITKKGTITLIR
ncbi:hypothetical protein BH09BAC2_BH09BAC2_06560 [soil metagenome]